MLHLAIIKANRKVGENQGNVELGESAALFSASGELSLSMFLVVLEIHKAISVVKPHVE